MKYSEWLNIWLENYIKPSSKERTYIRYGQLILYGQALDKELYRYL